MKISLPFLILNQVGTILKKSEIGNGTILNEKPQNTQFRQGADF